eukprot:566132-Hanusia_phi.AAC.1
MLNYTRSVHRQQPMQINCLRDNELHVETYNRSNINSNNDTFTDKWSPHGTTARHNSGLYSQSRIIKDSYFYVSDSPTTGGKTTTLPTY